MLLVALPTESVLSHHADSPRCFIADHHCENQLVSIGKAYVPLLDPSVLIFILCLSGS